MTKCQTLPEIILILIYKCDTNEVHGNASYILFEENVFNASRRGLQVPD